MALVTSVAALATVPPVTSLAALAMFAALVVVGHDETTLVRCLPKSKKHAFEGRYGACRGILGG
jgi:hypothetical protein